MGKHASSVVGLRSVGTIGIILATSSVLATGYLAKVGPVPLRYQPAHQNSFILPPITANEAVPDGNNEAPFSTLQPPFAPRLNLQSESFALPGSPLIAALNGISPETIQSRASIPQPVISGTESSTANDLLVITPQMLVEYFKPMSGTTNGSGASVIVPVTFTPATPAVQPSSKAIYKTQ